MIFAALVLSSTLAVLSHAYVLDQSCWNYPAETRDGIVAAMAEAHYMAQLGAYYVTFDMDDFDTTKSQMLPNAEPWDLSDVQGMWHNLPSCP
jgi:hypothetical protein